MTDPTLAELIAAVPGGVLLFLVIVAFIVTVGLVFA